MLYQIQNLDWSQIRGAKIEHSMVELDFWNVPCYLKNSRQYVIPISRKKCHVIIGDFFKHRVCEPLLAKSLPNLNVKISRPDSRAWNWVQLYVTLIRLNRIRQNWKLARDSILTYHDALFEVLPKSQGFRESDYGPISDLNRLLDYF